MPVGGGEGGAVSRRYEELVEVRTGPAAEHGVRVEGALPALVASAGASGVVQEEPQDGARAQARAEDRVEDRAQAPDMVEVPTVFLWRGRVHMVRAVLAQWSQRVPWWRSEDPVAEGLERRVWRVEAGAGRSMGTGVYDLVQDERWWLARVSD